MGMASECDLCGAVYKLEKGTVSLTVHVNIDSDGFSDSWGDVDYCPACSKKILDLIGPSLLELEATLAK